MARKFVKAVLRAGVVFSIAYSTTIVLSSTTYASDNYPSPDRGAVDCSNKFGIYSWCVDRNGNGSFDNLEWMSGRGFGYRNCTDFASYAEGVAWSSFKFPSGKGNAVDWKDYAANAGFTVTSSPAVGDVAWWGSEVAGGYGHVAVVTGVSGDGSASVEEYNWNRNGTYGTRSSVRADAYLHRGGGASSKASGAEPNSIGVGVNADGRLEAWGVNTHIPDGQSNIFHSWQTSPGGQWSSWAAVNGYLTTITVGRNQDGRLEVFGANAHQPDNVSNIYHAWQTSPGSPFSNWSLVNGYLG